MSIILFLAWDKNRAVIVSIKKILSGREGEKVGEKEMSARQRKIVDSIYTLRPEIDANIIYLEKVLAYAEAKGLDNTTDPAKLELKQKILEVITEVSRMHYKAYDTLTDKMYRLGVRW